MADPQLTAQSPLKTATNALPIQGDLSTMDYPSLKKEKQRLVEQRAPIKVEAEQAKEKTELKAKQAGVKATEPIEAEEREVVKKLVDKVKWEDPAFHPTEENAASLGSLFSMVATVGVALGSSGKLSAMNAMNAMSGMLEGWREGRQDLYNKEKDKFDKELASLKSLRETIKFQIEQVQKYAASDKKRAQEEAEIASRLLGQDSVATSLINSGRIDDAIKLIDDTIKPIEQIMMVRERERAKQESKDSNLSGPEKKELRGLENLKTEIQRLKDTFKPEYANMKMDVIGEAKAVFDERIRRNPEMAAWWRAYENVAIPERHAMFGATLTGGEKESWRRASIGPGNSSEAVDDWIKEKTRVLDNKISQFEKMNSTRKSAPTEGDILGIM